MMNDDDDCITSLIFIFLLIYAGILCLSFLNGAFPFDREYV